MAAALVVASLIPLGQSLEGLAGSALYLRGRYDIRAGFLVWSMTLRLAGVAIGAQYGLVAGGRRRAHRAADRDGFDRRLRLGRLPPVPPRRRRLQLGELRREIFSFIAQSSIGDRRPLAPLRARAVAARRRHEHDPGRHLQDRAVAAVRLPGALGAGPDGAAHRADARVGARAAGRGAPAGAPLQRYRGACCLVAVPPLYWVMPHLIADLRVALRRRDGRRADLPPHRRGAARGRLDEVVAGDARAAEAPDLDARSRDARRAPAGGRARLALGSDRCGRRVPRGR